MPKFKMELGAEPKKVAILALLLVVAAVAYYMGIGTDENGSPASRPAQAPPASGNGLPKALASRGSAEAELMAPPKASTAKRQRQEFRPSLKAAQESADPARIDPTLRLDLLQKLASVSMASGGRSLFEFGPDTVAAPKPALPEPKIEVKPVGQMHGPDPPPPPPPPPVKPPPPPINLKFYGASLPIQGGAKRVFCLQGDEIFTPSEGDLIQKRYRIVRINPSSVLVEDVEHKHQQMIPIDEPPKG
jgi:hypothetical protein